MGRSQESFNKKNVRNKKEKKRKEKEEKRMARKEAEKKSPDDMIAYVDEHGRITDAPPDPSDKEEIDAEDIELGVPARDEEDDNPVRKGTVSFFNDAKGYGFIKDLETKQNLFVHINNCHDEIKEGNMVTFEIGAGQKGPAAMNVKLHK
jgi:cold shock CspA family protein